MSLTVHRSRSLERLVDRLADDLSDVGGLDPFVPEQIAVQSTGVQRWLTQKLSERVGASDGRGISANIAFPFPGALVRGLVDAVLETGEQPDPWQPDRLVWTILEVLPEIADHEAGGLLASYLQDGRGAVGRRRWSLARQIADVLDRYALYRPTMVAAWRAGQYVDPDGTPLAGTQQWQPLLWERLDDRLVTPSPDQRLTAAIESLRAGDVDGGRLPPRVALFGTGALPPRHVEVFAALATRIPVGLYLSPASAARWDRLRAAADDGSSSPEEAGARHPLLTSCGRLGRDFQIALEREAGGYGDPVRPQPPGGDPTRVLELLRADLVADRRRGAPGRSDPDHPAPVDLDDDSVQLHACHGAARQVEVLHEVLLELLDRHADLQPRDVVIMTPDIERFAPLVSSVFGTGTATSSTTRQEGRTTLPFQLADRALRRTNPVAEVLLELLAMVDSRLQASRVLDLLALDPVRRRFGFSEDDLSTIREWVADTGIRWGIDADHRAAHGQPREVAHTWRAGLDRLLLGVAMADEDDRVLEDTTPFDDMEGGDVDLLSRLAAFCDALFATVRDLQGPRPVADWAADLRGALDALTAVERDRAWLDHQVRRTLGGLVERAGEDPEGTGAPALELTGIRTVLEDALGSVPRSAGYETGRITVSSLIPMPSVPHRVVCLLGMDDDVFPRVQRPPGFDLTAGAERVGDRTVRDEDRYRFLQALQAPSDHLVITYAGRDLRTNERRAPAVPVGELLDVLDRSLDGDGTPARDRLVTEHPLQPFSPRNFGIDDRGEPRSPLSADRAALGGARSLLHRAQETPEFFPEPLPAEDGDGQSAPVELAELRWFYDNPTRWLLNRRLGLWLREDTTVVEDLEPVDADPLASWRIADARLQARLEGRDIEDWRRALEGRGTVPVGTPGRYEVREVADTVDGIVARVDGRRSDQPEDRPIDIEVDGRRLMGVVPDVHDGTVLRWQYTRIKPKHRLRLWLEHLTLTVASPGTAVRSALIGRAGSDDEVESVLLPPLAGEPEPAARRARELLAPLVGAHLAGRREPLALFPRSSAAYAEALHDGKPRETALRRARGEWYPNYLGWGGDVADPHVDRVFSDRGFEEVVATTDFEDIAVRVWRPVLEALQ